jgi:hypothetical protein
MVSMAIANSSSVPAIERGETVDGVLYRGGKRARTRAELQRALAPAVAAWIEAACRWDEEAALSDHRFVIFSTDISHALAAPCVSSGQRHEAPRTGD